MTYPSDQLDERRSLGPYGVLDAGDYRLAARWLCEAFGYAADSAAARGVATALGALFDRMLAHMDADGDRVITRDELLNEVWGYQDYPCTRTVDNHMMRLRQKLESDPSKPSHFLTVYGQGYKFLP